ncbi:Vegetative incompatibility protein HET-E-1 [Grifola frondosa]|uniref:Vegetative incompatibility protein HET-E-1 n=1 Tax=Grifola frondosa TaxID=5627 RepID=A0A1C7LRW8_GRIFR|nr:Vegetative incompatibility protein HET-E-1 [Grifola frondosa]
MQSGVEVKRLSLRQSGAEKLPAFASVFVRFVSPSYKTRPCRTSTRDAWRRWDAAIAIDSDRFTVQVMQSHIFGFRSHELGRVDISLSEFADVQEGATCEKTFVLTSADGNPAKLEITIIFSGLRIKIANQLPSEPEAGKALSQTGQETHCGPSLSSVFVSIDAGERLREVGDRANSAREVISDPRGWVEKFDKSRVYMDIVVQMVQSVAELHPMATIAVKALTMAYDVAKQQADIHNSLQSLVSSMEEMLSTLAALHDLDDVLDKIKMLEDTIEHAIKNVKACADFICEYSQRNFADKLIRQPLTQDRIEELKASFSTLRLRLIEAVGVQNLKAVYDTKAIGIENLKVARDTKADEALQKLPRARNAHYDAGLRCLDGTRTDILHRIFEWIDDVEPGRNMFWLKAIAGSGKSTIASTIASCLDSDKGTPPTGLALVDHRVPSLMRVSPLKDYILRSIDADPDVGKTPVMNQFQKLIIDPLFSFKQPASEVAPVIVIVIDALDECGDSSSRKAILRCLVGQSGGFPSWVKILVTSRPESDIEDSLNGVKDSFPLEASNEEQRSDVAKYIYHRVGELTRKMTDTLGGNWLDPEKTQELIRRSDGLFIWARLSLDFIEKEPSPRKALDVVLSEVPLHGQNEDSRHVALNRLYGTVLRSASEDLNQERIPLILHVLGRFPEMLPMRVMRRRSPSDVVMPPDFSATTIHSFANPLCTHTSPRLPSLRQSMDCTAVHPEISALPLRVTVGLDDFWSPQVLVFDGHQGWVLDARFSPDKRKIASIDSCGSIHVWNADSGHTFLEISYSSRLRGKYTGSLSFSPDGKRLVTQFSGGPTLIWSTETGDEYERKLQEHSGGRVSWSPDGRFIASVDGDGHGIVWNSSNFQIIDKAVQSLKEHPRICYLEFSSDSKWLATAGEDGSVCIWDGDSWDQIQTTKDPTYTEKKNIKALAFSPDRRKLAWFPQDRDKVTIWDIEHNALSHLPIHHTDDHFKGRSLAFSPDGRALAVGCKSGLLVVREVATGAILHELNGHGDCVRRVEFAQTMSGPMLLSCSVDGTVRLWDVGTLNLSSGSSDEGPMAQRCSISPDGRSLAAWDMYGPCFIRETCTGTNLQLPYVNDGRRVDLATFSPDGRRLAILGPGEELLYLWDVENRTTLPSSIPADEVKFWAAAAIHNFLRDITPSVMSFSPDAPPPTHSLDMSQLVAVRTVADEDGWIYAEKDNSRMRLCYLPALHRPPDWAAMIGAGTHAATICPTANYRLTILDMEGLLRVVPDSYHFPGKYAINRRWQLSEDSSRALSPTPSSYAGSTELISGSRSVTSTDENEDEEEEAV